MSVSNINLNMNNVNHSKSSVYKSYVYKSSVYKSSVYIDNKRKDPKHDILTFTIRNVGPSIVNALRRTILSDIETVGVVSEPHEKNEVDMIENRTKLNNEFLKHRLSLIPIHIDDIETTPFENLEIEIKVKNDSDSYIDITTEHFKLYDSKLGTYMNKEDTMKIFPPNKITGDYPLFTRLRPNVMETNSQDRIHIRSPMRLCKAKTNSVYNVVSTCSYHFSEDKDLQNIEWKKKEKELKDDGMKEEDIQEYKINWSIHEAKRYYKKDEYEFKLETIGVFTNETIVKKACQSILQKLEKIESQIKTNRLHIQSITNINNQGYDVKIENDNYTIGKILEDILYKKYYMEQSIFSFISYKKEHPHIDYGMIRLALTNSNVKSKVATTKMNSSTNEENKTGHEEDDYQIIYRCFLDSIETCKHIYKNIKLQI